MSMNSKTSQSSTGSEQLISLSDVLQIMKQRWKAGVFFAVVTAAIVVGVLMTQPPIYRSNSSLVVELDSAKILDATEIVDSGVKNHNLLDSFMNTHIERLKSRSMAERVEKAIDEEVHGRLRRAASEAADSEAEETEKRADIASLIQRSLEVMWESESQALQIEITHSDPLVAQTLANTYVDEYIGFNAQLRSESTTGAVAFLGRQVEELREELRRKESELQDYRRQKNLIALEGGGSIVLEKLEQLNAAVTDANVRLLAAESRMNQIRKAGDDLDKLMTISFVGGREDVREIYAQLQELRREFSVLDATYLSKHPRVVDNLASQNSVKESLWQAIDQARREVEVELNTVKDELASLEKHLVGAESAALEKEQFLTEFRILERSVENLRQTYDMLSTRYSETSIAQRINLSSIRPLDMARYPASPFWPDKKKVALAAIFLAGLVFVAVPMGLEFLDSRVKSFADVESLFRKPVIGDIREIKKGEFPDIAKGVLRADNALAEPFRMIYSNLRMRTELAKKPVSFVVTSSLPAEGKSIVSANLAAAIAAHNYRVLVVDFDLRRSVLHEVFGRNNEAGLIRWMQETGGELPEDPLDSDALGIEPISEGLSLLRSGGTSEHPSEFVGNPRVAALMARLKEHFDVLVFDTPPVGLFPDATLVAEYADRCVFVTRQFKVQRNKARYAVSVMDHSNAPVVGVIFNGIRSASAAIGFNRSMEQYYGHGYEKDARKYQKYYSAHRREKAS